MQTHTSIITISLLEPLKVSVMDLRISDSSFTCILATEIML